jgi:hypothetical protein
MNKKETAKILGLIQAYYPKFIDGRDPEITLEGWQLIFADDSYQVVQCALMAYVSTDTKGFPPMPGALKDLMKPKVSEIGEFEAWRDVKKALSNSLYGSVEEYEKLSPICKRLVGSPSVLKEWAQMDISELDTVIASNFQRNYRAIQQNQSNWEKLPEAITAKLPGFETLGLMMPKKTYGTERQYDEKELEERLGVNDIFEKGAS